MKIPRMLTAALVGALSLVVATSTPAFAVDNAYNTVMTSGRIKLTASFITVNFDTPGSSIPTCTGTTTTITGKVVTPGSSNNMEATLAISTPFDDPVSTTDYFLSATGTTGAISTTNTNPGSFNDTTDVFTDMVIPVSFTISTFNRTTCTIITTACSGTITITATGGSQSGSIVPFDTSDAMYVNASGVIDVTSTACPGSIGAVVRDNATLTLMDNPTDDIPPTGTDQGAVFHQV